MNLCLIICLILYILLVLFGVLLPLRDKFRTDTSNKLFYFNNKAYKFSDIERINIKISTEKIYHYQDVIREFYVSRYNSASKLYDAFDFEMILKDGSVIERKLRCNVPYYYKNLDILKDYVQITGEYDRVKKESIAINNNNSTIMWIFLAVLIFFTLIGLFPLLIIIFGMFLAR